MTPHDGPPGPGWQLVRHADECEECVCGEPFCPEHELHYAECPCIGPTEDGVEYLEWPGQDGPALWGRREVADGTQDGQAREDGPSDQVHA